MTQELTLKIPRKFAPLLVRALGLSQAYSRDPAEKSYIQSLVSQVQTFIDTPEPIPVRVTVIAIDGVPVDRR